MPTKQGQHVMMRVDGRNRVPRLAIVWMAFCFAPIPGATSGAHPHRCANGQSKSPGFLRGLRLQLAC